MKSFLLVLDIKAEAGTHKIHVKSPQTEKPVIIFRHGNTGNLHYSVKTLDVNKIFIGAPSGGLWKTTDMGENWTVLTDHLPAV